MDSNGVDRKFFEKLDVPGKEEALFNKIEKLWMTMCKITENCPAQREVCDQRFDRIEAAMKDNKSCFEKKLSESTQQLKEEFNASVKTLKNKLELFRLIAIITGSLAIGICIGLGLLSISTIGQLFLKHALGI